MLLERAVFEVAVVAVRPVTDWRVIQIMAIVLGLLSMLIVAVPFPRTLPLLTVVVSVHAAPISPSIAVIISVCAEPVSFSSQPEFLSNGTLTLAIVICPVRVAPVPFSIVVPDPFDFSVPCLLFIPFPFPFPISASASVTGGSSVMATGVPLLPPSVVV